jgi:hypothetical protein
MKTISGGLHMKLSWTGIAALALLVVGSVLKFLELGDISNWAVRITPVLIAGLMFIISIMVWRALTKRDASERWPWLWFMFAAIANTLAMVFEAIPSILGTSDITLTIVSSGFFLVAYICFIVGFWLESIQVEWVTSKFNIWLPLVINIIGFGVVTYFLIREFSVSNISGILSVTFISFVAMDFILIGVIWAVVARTRGGRLSIPYLTIGIGCLVLVIFHIIVTFLTAKNMFNVDHVIRILLMLALSVIVVGGDLRHSIEKQLE